MLGSAFKGPAQCDDLREGARDAHVVETGYFSLHQGLARTRVGRAVGVDNVLVMLQVTSSATLQSLANRSRMRVADAA